MIKLSILIEIVNISFPSSLWNLVSVSIYSSFQLALDTCLVADSDHSGQHRSRMRSNTSATASSRTNAYSENAQKQCVSKAKGACLCITLVRFYLSSNYACYIVFSVGSELKSLVSYLVSLNYQSSCYTDTKWCQLLLVHNYEHCAFYMEDKNICAQMYILNLPVGKYMHFVEGYQINRYHDPGDGWGGAWVHFGTLGRHLYLD